MSRFWLIALIAAPALASARQITLDEAVDYALKNNRDLRAAQIALAGANYGVEAAAADFAPALRPDGNASAGDQTQTAQIGIAAEKRFESGTAISAGPKITSLTGDRIDPQRTGTIRVQVEQPLFRRFGGLQNREGLTRAEQAVLSARREIEMRRTDLIVQVVAAHEGLLQLQQREEYDRQSLLRLDKLGRLAAAREKQGRASRVDTLRASLQRGRAESSLQTTREQIESRRRDYSDLLGLAPTTDLVAVAGARIEIYPLPPEEASAIALSNRLDYAQVLQDLGDAARGIKIAQKNLLPDVSLVARYDWLGQGKSYGDAMNLNDNAWFVGLAAGNTDLARSSERAALKLAESGRLGTELRAEIVRNAITRQVQNELSAHARARQQVTVEERNYSLAAERARLTRRLYEMDRTDNFTVSDAEDQLQQAEASVLAARAEASLAAFRVLRALGTLIEPPADLRPPAAR